MVHEKLLLENGNGGGDRIVRPSLFCCSRIDRRTALSVVGYVELVGGFWLFLHVLSLNFADLLDNKENDAKLKAANLGRKRKFFLNFLPGSDKFLEAEHHVYEDERALLLWSVAWAAHVLAAMAALLATWRLRRVFSAAYVLISVVLLAASIGAVFVCFIGFRKLEEQGTGGNLFTQTKNIYLAYAAQFAVYAAFKLYFIVVALRACCNCC